ncbi:MAG: hypothetical protein ED555_13355 [Allomuricauda sp.]|nr:MAG: hypothetical protein ED555_13355 [Allomuricauda sp.]
MEKTTPRRSFLEKSLKASVALAIGSSTMPAMAFENGNHKTSRTNLRTLPFGKYVSVEGTIFEKDGRTPLSNATVEVWHLSPGSETIGHQGELKTDAAGAYHMLTDIPNREFGKHHKIHFKVSRDGDSYTTELSFNGYGAYISGKHWEENRQLEDHLLFPTHETFLNKTTIQFNLTFNY